MTTITELIAEARAFRPGGGGQYLDVRLADALEEVTKEMHARELHHFETEQYLAEVEGKP